MTRIATQIGTDSTTASGARQRHYQLSEPLDGHSHVVVSATAVFDEPETYIFGADSEGDITNWGELEGSYRGGLDHEEALRRAGYEVAVQS